MDMPTQDVPTQDVSTQNATTPVATTQPMPPQFAEWDKDNVSRVPYSAYTDPQLYQRELERLFYKNHWAYVALECEIPSPGDFKTTFIGERSVVVVRDTVYIQQ